MNRQDFRLISRLRRKEAEALLKVKHFAGAYYLLGYAVECAIKACIAKRTKRHDFPDKRIVNMAHAHNLEQLVKVAELEQRLKREMRKNAPLALNWAVVKDWTAACRYDHNISEAYARNLHSACTSRQNGILTWIVAQW